LSLICIINDGGYGVETHKFRAYGVDPMHATHGRDDLARIARGFGLSGTKKRAPRINESMAHSPECEKPMFGCPQCAGWSAAEATA
jgi:thiamine pyrophosphate-dependent acetolactate synthase large subunit-like protein